MTLAEAVQALTEGRTRVCYKNGWQPVQYGHITSVNERWVFVRYDTTLAGNSQATAPENLDFDNA